MLAARQAGAVILPPCPGFYHRPTSIDDLVDFVVARVLSALGIEQQLVAGWKEEETSWPRYRAAPRCQGR